MGNASPYNPLDDPGFLQWHFEENAKYVRQYHSPLVISLEQWEAYASTLKKLLDENEALKKRLDYQEQPTKGRDTGGGSNV